MTKSFFLSSSEGLEESLAGFSGVAGPLLLVDEFRSLSPFLASSIIS
jgi:hypothetical protein